MKKKFINLSISKIIILLMFLVLNYKLLAEIYITDKLQVPLRSGYTLKHRILKMLKVGKKVVLIEKNKNGWSKVTIDNLEGWVLSRYLTKENPPRTLLADIEKKFSSLNIKYVNKSKKLEEIRENNENLNRTLTEITVDRNKIKEELRRNKLLYERAINLDTENIELKQKILSLNNDIILLKQLSSTDSERNKQILFIIGGIMVALSIITGIILSKIFLYRKKNYY